MGWTKRSIPLCIIPIMMLLLGALPSQAQSGLFRYGRQGEHLGKGDSDLLFGASEQLNATTPIHVGDTKEWNNADTGNSGVVKIMRVFSSRGLDCHTLRYALSFRKTQGSKTYMVDWCKTNAGWKIAS